MALLTLEFSPTATFQNCIHVLLPASMVVVEGWGL